MLIRKIALFFYLSLVNFSLQAADNVVLITIDGLRWQEAFAGIDRQLAEHERFGRQRDRILAEFWADTPRARAIKLMPFLHQVLIPGGSVVGNRFEDSCAAVSNDRYFSYPGYSEILTGVVNPAIDSNAKRPNPEQTFLELLEAEPGFQGSTAAFASWDVFPSIFNVERSGVFVNAFSPYEDPESELERLITELHQDTPPPWPNVRNDVFTHHYALAYLERVRPRVLYIGYGETDDFAHDGKYDQYLFAARRTDRFIREVWDKLQSLEGYRDNTVLLVTVDHGRGAQPLESWRHHSSKSATASSSSLSHYEDGIVGSEAVWIAAIGPRVREQGSIETGDDCLTSNRIAATLMELLGEDYRDFNSEMGAPLRELIE